MDWTDTMMLETTRDGSIQHRAESIISARLVTTNGVTLLATDATSYEETASALALLRGAKAAGRRVVFCDTSRLGRGRQLGCELVEQGGAELLVSCGLSGREIAIGARDAGLALANVIVCRHDASACEVLAHRLAPGDTVLLLGTDREACDRLVEGLDKRSSGKLAVAS